MYINIFSPKKLKTRKTTFLRRLDFIGALKIIKINKIILHSISKSLGNVKIYKNTSLSLADAKLYQAMSMALLYISQTQSTSRSIADMKTVSGNTLSLSNLSQQSSSSLSLSSLKQYLSVTYKTYLESQQETTQTDVKYLVVDSLDSAPSGWETIDFDDSSWSTATIPIASAGYNINQNTDADDIGWTEGKTLLVRVPFTFGNAFQDANGNIVPIQEVDINIARDEKATVYWNGNLLVQETEGGTLSYWNITTSTSTINKTLKIKVSYSGATDVSGYQLRLDLRNYYYLSEGEYLVVKDEDGNVLPFCFEDETTGEANNTTASRILWIKLDLIAGSTTYLYVDITDTNNATSPENIFELFDNFSTDTIGTKWERFGTYSESTFSDGIYYHVTTSKTGGLYSINKINPIGKVIEVRIAGYPDGTTHDVDDWIRLQYYAPPEDGSSFENTDTLHFFLGDPGGYYYITPNIRRYVNGDIEAEVTYSESSRLTFDLTTVQMIVENETTARMTINNETHTLTFSTALANDGYYLVIGNDPNDLDTGFKIDWIRIRKYIPDSDLTVEILPNNILAIAIEDVSGDRGFDYKTYIKGLYEVILMGEIEIEKNLANVKSDNALYINKNLTNVKSDKAIYVNKNLTNVKSDKSIYTNKNLANIKCDKAVYINKNLANVTVVE